MKLLFKDKYKFNVNIKESFLESILPRFKEERISAFLTLSSTLLAIIIFGLFAINPTLTTIAQLKKQLADSKFVDQKLVEKISSLSSLQQNYVQVQDNLNSVMNAIPPLPNIPLFIAQIQTIAQTSQVHIVKIQTLPVEVSPDIPINGYISFVFTITATGTTAAINSFIINLQSFDRLITTDGLSIIKSTDNPNIQQLLFTGKLYFKKVS